MSEGAFRYHKYMIKSAPYGQLQSVIDNLNKISPIDLQSTQAQQTLKQYNEEHFALIKINNQQSHYPLTPFSRNQNSHYVDQFNKKSYKVNHLTREVEHQQQAHTELPQAVTQLLEILSQKVNKYVDKYYRQPYGSQGKSFLNKVFMEVTQEGSLNVHIAFTSKNVQLGNYFTGEWSSTWLINKSKIEGKVTIRSHIFESGNVQMNQDKTFSENFEFTANMQENANKIIKMIEGFECQIQKNLNHTYEEMPNGFFKHLRRIVPVTKVKMIWNVHALKMNKNLQQTKK